MYCDTTHTYRELNLYRAGEIANLRRVGRDRSPVRMAMGIWFIALDERLVAPRPGPAPVRSGV